MKNLSICTGDCDYCRHKRTVPGTDERIDREPSYYCALWEEAEVRAYNRGYNDALDRVEQLLGGSLTRKDAHKRSNTQPADEAGERRK